MATCSSAPKPIVRVSAFVEHQLYDIHMATCSSALKPPVVVSSAFVEQQLYDIHMATCSSAPKPLVRLCAFVKALQNQLFVSGGSGTHTIDANVNSVFQIIQSGSISLIPGAENFYFDILGIHRLDKLA